MKIVYTFQQFSYKGGIERIFCDKANALAAAGHEVHLVYSLAEDAPPAYATDPRVRTHNLGVVLRSGSRAGLPFNWLRYRINLNRAMQRTLRRIGPDIVVITPIMALKGCFSKRWKVVMESHLNRADTMKASAFVRARIRRAERRADAIVALTAEDAAAWARTGKTLQIANFTDIRPAERPAAAAHSVCAVGRLHEQKQFDLLVDAWAETVRRHPGWRLDIYGYGDEREALQRHISELGLTDSVCLRGAADDMAAVYASHDFLALSSRREGFGLVLIEAMACGCPCVAVDCPAGPREIISDGRDGLLVPYRGLAREQQVRNLAGAMCRMIESPEMRARMGREARLSSLRYDKRAIMDQWEKLFEELAG